MLIQCPHCSAPLESLDLVRNQRLVQCRHCEGEYALDPGVLDAIPESKEVRERPQPRGVSVEREGSRLNLVMRWFSLKAVAILVPINAVWNGALYFLYADVINRENAAWIHYVFPIAHVAIGVLLLYVLAATLLNRTRIVVDREELSVAHYPLPWPGRRRIPVQSIEQLYCTRSKPRNRETERVSFELRVRLRGGAEQKLLKGQHGSEQIRFLEQQIERTLGLVDHVVEGELPG